MGNVSAHRTNVPPTSAYSYCPSSSRSEYEPIPIPFPIHSSHVRSLLQHSLNAHGNRRHSVVGKHCVLGEHFASNLDRRSTQILCALLKLGMTVQAILHIASVSLSHIERLHEGIHAPTKRETPTIPSFIGCRNSLFRPAYVRIVFQSVPTYIHPMPVIFSLYAV